MYSTAAARANSTAPPVLLARIEYCLVSSTSVITEQTEVSLNRAMKSLVTGGITIRTAWGTITRRKAIRRDIPSASAASIWPAGIACKPGAVDLGLVGRIVDRQPADPRDPGRQLQQVEQDEKLEHQRRAADQLDVAGQEPRKRPRPVEPADRHEQADRHRQRHRGDRQRDRHQRRVEQRGSGSGTSRPASRSPRGSVRVDRIGPSNSASSLWASVQMPYCS